MKPARKDRERQVIDALRDLAQHVDLPTKGEAPRARRLAVLPPPTSARARTPWVPKLVAAAAAIVIAAASFAVVWRSFSGPTPPPDTPADPTSGWVSVSAPGVSLSVPPGSTTILRTADWAERLRRDGASPAVVRAWRDNDEAFVVAVDLPRAGTIVVWRPRPARALQGWISARLVSIGAVPARDIAGGGLATIDGHDAIHKVFDLRPGYLQLGYETVAGGSRWNISFSARRPSATDLERLDLILSTISFDEVAP